MTRSSMPPSCQAASGRASLLNFHRPAHSTMPSLNSAAWEAVRLSDASSQRTRPRRPPPPRSPHPLHCGSGCIRRPPTRQGGRRPAALLGAAGGRTGYRDVLKCENISDRPPPGVLHVHPPDPAVRKGRWCACGPPRSKSGCQWVPVPAVLVQHSVVGSPHLASGPPDPRAI